MPKKQTDTKSGKPSCTQDHPDHDKVYEACELLIQSSGSCCPTIFKEHYPDLYDLFDPSRFASFLSQKGVKIKNDYAAQGITIPTYNHRQQRTAPRAPRAPAPAETDKGEAEAEGKFLHILFI